MRDGGGGDVPRDATQVGHEVPGHDSEQDDHEGGAQSRRAPATPPHGDQTASWHRLRLRRGRQHDERVVEDRLESLTSGDIADPQSGDASLVPVVEPDPDDDLDER
jgi:hypothetical protein